MDAGARAAPLACVVANPSKQKVTGAARDLLDATLREAGYRTPVWLETTTSETGATQARLAVASGAALVVAAGGDGTVRSVAAGLAGTGVEMGILPTGTANLAARNLRLPVGDLSAAAHLVANGTSRPTDLAWVRTDPADEPGSHPYHPPADPVLPGMSSSTHSPAPAGSGGALSALTARRETQAPQASTANGVPEQTSAFIHDSSRRANGTAPGADAAATAVVPAQPPGGWARPSLGREHACMVVSGIGFDAGLVASTRPGLKARIGWGAYALAAVENLRFPRMDLVLSLGSPGAGGSVERFTARTLLIANGGMLPAGITLLRDTRPDDGLLDVAAIDTVGGVLGWSSLARQVLPPRAATYANPTRATGRVVRRQGSDIAVRVSTPMLVEVDGDLLPPTRGVRVRLAHGALLIRRP
ncbi:diacylglycerol/lipid kinase family protein [Actinomyces wuliandei]|uniref:diacylglycerol/lipid kinase family protein n=1 Tax=Actinomyces wuliandei TaxID=2057743 RepID=UPI000FDAD449|nr:diacylglycerol kinase family protein [Actinomyces wuliandei]